MTSLSWELGSVDENDVAGWVADVVPGPAPVAGPVAILQRKRWGITVAYRRGRRRVVVKVSRPALFPQAFLMENFVGTVAGGRAPKLLGHGSTRGTDWRIFEYTPGLTADSSPRDAVVAMAESLAHIQAAAARRTRPDGLPVVTAGDVALLLPDLPDQPPPTVMRLHQARPILMEWAAELDAWPMSVDHTDLNDTNGIVRRSGRVVIVDWEEAVIACPFFSLDRLLEDARKRGVARAVTSAYLSSLPWGTLPERRRALGLALALAPLKAIHDAREFFQRIGRLHPPQRLTASMLTTAFGRWDQLSK